MSAAEIAGPDAWARKPRLLLKLVQAPQAEQLGPAGAVAAASASRPAEAAERPEPEPIAERPAGRPEPIFLEGMACFAQQREPESVDDILAARRMRASSKHRLRMALEAEMKYWYLNRPGMEGWRNSSDMHNRLQRAVSNVLEIHAQHLDLRRCCCTLAFCNSVNVRI